MKWALVRRPGYFGRKRDEKVAALNQEFGVDNWRLVWKLSDTIRLDFRQACKLCYEFSYFKYLRTRPEDLEFICSFGECIDNAVSNIQSGCDYTKQEAFSTHIQDIAVRNVLKHLNLKFLGESHKVLVIRSKDSQGYRFGPGNIPFAFPELIDPASKCPKWANKGSVEDFWQSNKWIEVKKS